LGVLLMALIQLAPPGIARHCCPPSYDIFGPYTMPLLGKPGEMREVHDKMRGFIWAHWHHRQPGCAALTTTNPVEFVACTDGFIVEPDKQGRWRIGEELKCGPGGKGWPKATTERSTWYSVRRVTQAAQAGKGNEPLSDSADVPASSYLLILKDSSGRQRAEL